MVDLQIPPEELDRLRRLMDEGLSALSETQRRKVKIVAGVCADEKGKDIASREGVRPSAVSNVRKELRKKGLKPFLEKWEGAVRRARDCDNRIPGKPGPKGIISIEDWLKSQSADDEPVFEIAYLLIEPGANIAIFAVRDGKGTSSDFTDRVRKIVEEPVLREFHWSRLSVFDINVSRAISFLAAKFAVLAAPDVKFERISESSDPVPAIERSFGVDYRFIVLAQGETAERRVEKWGKIESWMKKLGPSNIHRLSDSDEFFGRLESTLYRIRERLSCPGFMPCHWLVATFAEKWVNDEQAGSFCYTCDCELFAPALSHQALLWRYVAIHGDLFSMTRGMWDRIQWREEFTLNTLKIRPQVFLEEKTDDPPGISVSVQIIPTLGYDFPVDPKSLTNLNMSKILRACHALFFEKELYIINTITHQAWDAKQEPSHQSQLSHRC